MNRNRAGQHNVVNVGQAKRKEGCGTNTYQHVSEEKNDIGPVVGGITRSLEEITRNVTRLKAQLGFRTNGILAEDKLGHGKYEGSNALHNESVTKPTWLVALVTKVTDEDDGDEYGEVEGDQQYANRCAGKPEAALHS